MFVDFRLASVKSSKFSLRMGIFEEKDGVVLDVSWPLLSGLASGIGVHQLDTSGSSCHTPAADMIKWAYGHFAKVL